MTREEAHQLIDTLFDNVAGEASEGPIEAEIVEPEAPEVPARTLPEGKRVVRTKSSGDRVYYLDEDKKTRQWVTNPDVLEGLGFELGDVSDVEDNELLKYQMGPALYRVPDATT